MRPLTDDDLPAALAINDANVPAVNELDADARRAIVEVSTVALAAVDPTGAALVGFCLVLAAGHRLRQRQLRAGSPSATTTSCTSTASPSTSIGVRSASDAALYAEVERSVPASVVPARGQPPPPQRRLAARSTSASASPRSASARPTTASSARCKRSGSARPPLPAFAHFDDTVWHGSGRTWAEASRGSPSSAPILEEAEVVADGGDGVGGDVGEQDRLGAGAGREQLAERVDDAAVARVVEPPPSPTRLTPTT